jgi:hypothetical protein
MSKSANKQSAASRAGPVPAAKPSQAITGKKTDAGSKQSSSAMLQSPRRGASGCDVSLDGPPTPTDGIETIRQRSLPLIVVGNR